MDRRRMMMGAGKTEHEYDWLRFDILTAGTVLWKCTSGNSRTISYRKNDGEWTNITSTTSGISISVAVGDVLEFKGNNVDYGGVVGTSGQGSYFAGTATYNASGDISTMLGNSKTLPADLSLAHLFHSANVVSAKKLILPYTILTKGCYYAMFYDCTSLTIVPELPATILGNLCYSYMFYNCYKIVEAPYLPATQLIINCYLSMFRNCSKLQYIRANFTTPPSSTYSYAWVSGVAAKGIFIKNPNAVWNVTGNSGVPTGWGDYPGLAFLIQTAGAIKFNSSDVSFIAYLEYSLDYGTTWSTIDSNGIDTFNVNVGDVVCLQSNMDRMAESASKFAYITSTATFSAVGKIKSIINDDNPDFDVPLPNVTYALAGLFLGNTGIVSARHLEMPSNVRDYCYHSMFNGCTNLKEAPTLPATTLAQSCYNYMFYGCSSLIAAPKLPATTMEDSCYYCMFYGCTSLTTAPDLPATTLATNCYRSMFNGCTNLKEAQGTLPAITMAQNCYSSMFRNTALKAAPKLPATTLMKSCYAHIFRGCTSLVEVPELPATTLADNCYSHMFYGCILLNKITCLATSISATDCTLNWVDGVAASGTFTKVEGVSWTTGVSGIPSGWEVEEVGRDYSKEYFTIKSLADSNTIGWKQTGSSIAKTIEVSTDKVTWTSYTSNTSGVTLATLSNGQNLYVRGSNTAYASSTNKYNTFTSTGNFDVEGNIMSLLYGDDFASKTTYPATYTFLRLFGSSKVVNAKNLILPATTATGRCYYAMFSGCTSMITAPKLPAKTLSTYCYCGMLYNTAITEAPELPATTLATYCYYRMFRGCTGLTKSPVLPAKTLTDSCYYQMFWQCSNLNHVTMLATDISASSCLYNWLSSVAATGTLVKDASMTTLPSGASGIPSGWTTEDYVE